MDIKGFKSRDGSVHQYDYESLANIPEREEVDLTGVVKSVNGVTPDENGNVKITIPDSSENVNKTLTFTGAVEATYDGTEEVTVNIPTGGGGYMTANAKALFRTLLYGAVYDKDVLPDPATTIEAFLAELDVVVPDTGGGDSGGDSGVYVDGDTLFVVSGVQVEAAAEYLVIS